MSQSAPFQPDAQCQVPDAPRYSLPLETARDVCRRIKDILAPACERIEIAGSVRREEASCHDIDLVVIPKFTRYDAGHALGQSVWSIEFIDCIRACNKWTIESGLHNTSRQVKLRSVSDPRLKIELYLTPPERFGWIYLLRTGDADFTKYLVMQSPTRGVQFKDGVMLVNHSVRDCYEEQDVFSAVGLPMMAPRERNRQRFWALWKAQGRA